MVQAVGDAGQVVVVGVLLGGRSGCVAVWWVDVWRHQHVSASGVELRCHVTIVGPVGEGVELYGGQSLEGQSLFVSRPLNQVLRRAASHVTHPPL